MAKWLLAFEFDVPEEGPETARDLIDGFTEEFLDGLKDGASHRPERLHIARDSAALKCLSVLAAASGE